MGPKEWKAAQLRNPTISAIYKMLAKKTLSHRRPNSKDDLELKVYLHQKSRLKLRNGVLYRHINTDQTEIACNYAYLGNTGRMLWRVAMMLLDTLELTE